MSSSSAFSSSSSSAFSFIPPIPSQIQSDERNECRRENVAQIAARLSQGEDLRLAMKMQEEEYQSHFSKNRTQRVTVAGDAKLSREEERKAMEERRKREEEITLRDEAMARELEKQLLEEESERAKEQEKKDEELAKILQME
ncbi:hypothetical protein niasHS_014731 [Heterodera schachtii]|uniref:Coiled-coil domain-containing protein n=1 Tax=Heterodera schachtii TaxID=97005 RepID=A0ABD2IFG9_HETSC